MAKKFIYSLWRHVINVFSGLSVLLAIFAVIAYYQDFDLVWTTVATILAIALAFGGSAFYAWKEEVQRIPQEADISIIVDHCYFSSTGSRGGIPTSPMKFVIGLDILNRGEEEGVLQYFDVSRFNLKNDILGKEPKSKELRITESLQSASKQVSLPLVIEKRKRYTRLTYTIEVEKKELNPQTFAARLKEFDSYEIELIYKFENLEREKTTKTISIDGDFHQFKSNLLTEWKSHPNTHDLVIVALESLDIL